MLKKIAIFTMLLLLFTIIIAGLMHTPAIKKASTNLAESITINNIPINEPPLIKAHIIYLPLRAICENTGYNIEWSEKATVLKKDTTEITLLPEKAVINKAEYKLKRSIVYNQPLLNHHNTLYISKQDIRAIFELNIIKERTAINIEYDNSNKFYITFSDGLGDNTLPLIYNDEFFNNSSYEYSPDLAQLCIGLSSGAHAMSSMNQAYKAMGYTASFYNYTTVNRTTSAYSIAEKELTDKKIYIVNIRGTSGDEWYTNFDIYKDKSTASSNHFGFSQAEHDVRSTLKKHLDGDDYTGRRIFLITGHSRGGAIANILGAHLSADKKYAHPRDIYTYTFATPNVSTNADVNMKNIYNFCNACDFITKLPINGREFDPDEKEWLYNKNGVTITFDNTDIKQTDLTSLMEQEFRAITGREFITVKKEAVQTAVLSLKLLLPTVSDYYGKPLGIGSMQMSAYEFFIGGLAASQTLGSAAEKGMLLIADGLFKGDMSDIAKFIVFNSAERSEKSKDGITREKGQGIKYNHSCEAYYSWVKAYNREYFSR